jgi:hypothetical protein
MAPANLQELEEDILAAIPERFTLAHAAPTYLASLYRLCLVAPRQFERLRTILLDRLLDLTVSQAVAQTSFYADSYRVLRPDQYVGLESLASLPV